MNTMTLVQARTILVRHNKWRRGGSGAATAPVALGEALDVAARVLAEHAPAMDTLRAIASNKRRTREQRMACACVVFLDSLAETALNEARA